jgi:pantothenate kinase type III
VWYVDPAPRTVTVYTSATQSKILGEDQSLDGGEVLPGFQLSIRDLFTRAGEGE